MKRHLVSASCLLMLAAGCDRRPRVVKVFPTSPPAIVWEVPQSLSCGNLEVTGPVAQLPARTSSWARCRYAEWRQTCAAVSFDEQASAPSDCLLVEPPFHLLEGGWWFATALDAGTTRFFEASGSTGLVIDASDAGVRSFKLPLLDAGVPTEPIDELVVRFFWTKDELEQALLFGELSQSVQLEVMRTTTPSLQPLFPELFESLPPEQARRLVDWQFAQALPDDGGASESSVLVFLLEHPEWWPADFPERVGRAWKQDVARPVLVAHAAWFGVPEAERELCRQLGRELIGPLDAKMVADVDAFGLAVIAERKLQCEWVPEVVRRELHDWVDCDDCSLSRSREAARHIIDQHLKPRVDDEVGEFFGEPAWRPSPALAALSVQKRVPWDLAIRLARLNAKFVGDDRCFDAQARRIVGLPPEVHHFVDDWSCDFTIDDARGEVLAKALKPLK